MERIIGIYKITNNINGHSYIGQSRDINRRWRSHKASAFNSNNSGYDYPLYCAIRKYGIQQFTFEILEECSIEQLNEREKYWISFYLPEYNQTAGGDTAPPMQKLTLAQVKEIQQILINDVNGNISHKELGERFGVSGKDTIRDINVGRTWYDPTLTYPLHYNKYDNNKPEKALSGPKYQCIDCGTLVWAQGSRCDKCARIHLRKVIRPSRDELKQLIRTVPFVEIGRQYGVTDNSVRKWCKQENLPTRKIDIKKLSNKDWEKI